MDEWTYGHMDIYGHMDRHMKTFTILKNACQLLLELAFLIIVDGFIHSVP